MTTREQIAVRIAEWDRQQVLRDVSYQKSADEIIAIAIKSPEAREYWLDKVIEAQERQVWHIKADKYVAIKAIKDLKVKP